MKTNDLLLIDAGNTRVKWATAAWSGRNIQPAGEVGTKNANEDRIARLARRHARHQVVLSCVVPKMMPWFQRAFKGRLCVVNGTLAAAHLVFDYPKPSELGADRLAGAIAIQAEGKYPSIIVSCGTATAFTVLDGKGRVCGGAIAPGLRTQLHALLAATAQLPSTRLTPPVQIPAKSTAEAIRLGVTLSFLGGVREILEELTMALPGRTKPRLIFTGGDAHVAEALGVPWTLRPLLVMEGLLIIGSRYFRAAS